MAFRLRPDGGPTLNAGLSSNGWHNGVIFKALQLRNSYTMGCPPVRGDNPRALASGLSYVQVDKHGITILYHLH